MGENAAHQRLRYNRGKATAQSCVKCAESGLEKAARDWARIHTESGEDIWTDYVPLCRSCHQRYDNDARHGPEVQARWREHAIPAIREAWTFDKRAAQAELTRSQWTSERRAAQSIPVDMERLRELAPVMSERQLAAELGVTRGVVRNRLKRLSTPSSE